MIPWPLALEKESAIDVEKGGGVLCWLGGCREESHGRARGAKGRTVTAKGGVQRVLWRRELQKTKSKTKIIGMAAKEDLPGKHERF